MTAAKQDGLPPDVLRSLATAVMGEGTHKVLMIRPDNRSGGWVGLEEAVASGIAFATVPAQEMLAIDCDDPGAGPALDVIATRLVAAGAEPVILESGGGPGRRHLFCRVDRSDLRYQLAQQARGAGLDVRDRSPIRPPGAPHRSGAPPRLVSHAAWTDAVVALSQPMRPASQRIPQALWSMITKGDTKARYRREDGSVDGSRLTLAICNSAVFNGIARDRVRHLLARPENMGGSSYRRRLDEGGRRADRWFDTTWDTAARSSWKPRRVDDRNGALVEVAELRAHAGHWNFSGRTGSTDATVLEACLILAERQGGPVAHLSVRALAESSGRAVPTVRKALSRLRAIGWLDLMACSERDRAARYRISVPASGCNGCTGSSSTGGVGTVQGLLDGHSPLEPGHDAFTPGALGAAGWRVLLALRDGEATALAVADALGMHVTTARRSLRRLHEGGLVEPLEDGSWRAVLLSGAGLEEHLDEVAERAGTAGRRERKVERHRLERARYQLWVVRQDQQRISTGVRVPRQWRAQQPLWGPSAESAAVRRAKAPPLVA